MSAPSKTTGGKGKSVRAASGRKTRGSGRSISRADVESVPRDTRTSTVSPRGRAEAIRSRTPKKSRGGSSEPPRYSNRSTRPQILEAAKKKATERGYGRLRLVDITKEAGISHQAFYGHFANKRHAVAVATSDELGTIADLAMRGTKQNEEWAERMLEDIDRTLAATYPATDGPERWLRDRITKAISTDGGFSALRIIELIRVSRLGHGEFYRRYGGKRGCLQRIYADALEELDREIGDRPSIAGVGEAIASDPKRAQLLVLGAPYLPDRDHAEEGRATKSSLLELLAGAVASRLGGSSNSTDGHVLVVAGGLLEVIRSAVLGDGLEALPGELSAFQLIDGRDAAPLPTLRLVA